MLEKQSTLVRKVNVQRMMAHTSGATLWQIAAGFVVVILVVRRSRAARAAAGAGGWDNAASLPYNQLDDGEIGAAWTTQRLCRHFRAPHAQPRSIYVRGGLTEDAHENDTRVASR